MKYTIIKWIAFTCILAVSGTATAFDFKGIEVGGPKTYKDVEVEDALSVITPNSIIDTRIECGKGFKDRFVCNGFTTIGGASAKANVVISTAQIVTRISLTIQSYNFDKVVSAAIEKYGKPTETINETVQNQMGAKYQDTTYLWKGKEGRYIEINKYYGSLDDSRVYFGTAEDTALLNEVYGPKKGDI